MSLSFSGTNLFAATSGSGVFLSTNFGANWNPVNTGLRNLQINTIAVLGANLFAGTEGTGVWRRPLSEMITSLNDLAGTKPPHGFSLFQNYPNPFNPNTYIEFSIPTETHVVLSVYNTLGQEVSKLISQDMTAGNYKSEWNASGFASGVYFYRFTAGDFTETKKLLLLK
jgi:hypothetical protein